MYRNKIIAIFTVMIIILLGVMIWSSNVVADHNAVNKKNPDTEQNGTVIGVEIPEEQRGDFITEEENEDDETSESGDEFIDEASGKRLVIVTDNLVPDITPRSSSTMSLNANYIDKFDFSQSLVLWNLSSFPLKVFIKDENNIPKEFTDAVRIAFGNWENASDKFATFEYVDQESAANIIVEVPENPSNECADGSPNAYKFNISGGVLKNAELIVPQKDCNGENVDTATLYAPLQHQIGHILGLSAHSDRPIDVMYATPSYENINISNVDVSTLKLLYNFVPTITDKYYTKKETTNMIRLSSLRGKDISEIKDALLEHINSKRTATTYEIAMDQAYEFYKAGKYDKAETKYLEASDNTKVSMDKALALRSLAILYLKMNRSQDAIRYANTTLDVSNTPYNQYLLAYINYESGNYDTSILRLEALIKEYPKLMAAYPVMAQIYRTKGDTEKIDELVKLSKEHFGSQSPVYYEDVPKAE